MNIHKRGIALSGRFCRMEHPTHTYRHHPRKKTSTSSTNQTPNTTHGRRQVPQVRNLKPRNGRRQVPQVRIRNHKPPTEEDKYLKYDSEPKTPRRKTKIQKYGKQAVRIKSIPIAAETHCTAKKTHQPSNIKRRKPKGTSNCKTSKAQDACSQNQSIPIATETDCTTQKEPATLQHQNQKEQRSENQKAHQRQQKPTTP